MKLQDPFEYFDNKHTSPDMVNLSEHFNRTIDELNTLLHTLNQTIGVIQKDIKNLTNQLPKT